MLPDLVKLSQWLLDLLLYIPKKIYSLIVDMLLSVIDAIFAVCPSCDPAFINNVFTGLPSDLMYFLGWFNFPQGLVIISGSYLIRFLIRRLPVVG